MIENICVFGGGGLALAGGLLCILGLQIGILLIVIAFIMGLAIFWIPS